MLLRGLLRRPSSRVVWEIGWIIPSLCYLSPGFSPINLSHAGACLDQLWLDWSSSEARQPWQCRAGGLSSPVTSRTTSSWLMAQPEMRGARNWERGRHSEPWMSAVKVLGRTAMEAWGGIRSTSFSVREISYAPALLLVQIFLGWGSGE